jgi:hypothetical protein
MRILIVGRIAQDGSRGKMAKLILDGCNESGIECRQVDGAPFGEGTERWLQESDETSIAVHLTKTHLDATIEECGRLGIVLVQAASGHHLSGRQVKAPVFDTPNLALGVLALFDVLPKLGEHMVRLGAKTVVAEGHQAEKTSPAITAETIGAWFGVPPAQIGHVRDDAVATAYLGVPPENHRGFASHRVVSILPGMHIGVEMKILGREVYFEGLKALATVIAADRGDLGPQVYNTAEYLFAS